MRDHIDVEISKHLKSLLAGQIQQHVKDHHMKQSEIGRLLNIPQARTSRLCNGYTEKFSIERLVRYLLQLGYELELHIQPMVPPHNLFPQGEFEQLKNYVRLTNIILPYDKI